MPRYYFDLHERDSVLIDDEGEDLRDAAVARKRAVQCLGEIIRDFAKDTDDQITVEAREGDRPIWRATARVLVESCE